MSWFTLREQAVENDIPHIMQLRFPCSRTTFLRLFFDRSFLSRRDMSIFLSNMGARSSNLQYTPEGRKISGSQNVRIFERWR